MNDDEEEEEKSDTKEEEDRNRVEDDCYAVEISSHCLASVADVWCS